MICVSWKADSETQCGVQDVYSGMVLRSSPGMKGGKSRIGQRQELNCMQDIQSQFLRWGALALKWPINYPRLD